MECYVSGEQLECGLLSAAKGDIRYYLNGVYVECTADNTRIVTTNGHHMLLMDAKPYQQNTFTGSFIIPRAVLEQIKPKTKRGSKQSGNAHYCIEVTPQASTGAHDVSAPPLLKIREVASTVTIDCVACEGRFPDYTRVIPSEDDLCRIAPSAIFNIEYLMLALKLYRIVADSKKVVSVPLRSVEGKTGAVRLSKNAWFVIMPIRSETQTWGNVSELNKFRTRIEVVEEKPLASEQEQA